MDKLKAFLKEYSFDNASIAWKKNKKSIGCGSYNYICGYNTSKNTPCQNKRFKTHERCKIHLRKKSSIDKSD